MRGRPAMKNKLLFAVRLNYVIMVFLFLSGFGLSLLGNPNADMFLKSGLVVYVGTIILIPNSNLKTIDIGKIIKLFATKK